MDLAQKHCIPCLGGIPPLKGNALLPLLKELQNDWKMIDEHHLQKDYVFDTYQEALHFTNLIASLAESEGHHPELLLSFRNVRVSIWTHKIDGMVESDFIFAAKSDQTHANDFTVT
jgi:4a-hydroxytetrahydrobiopterin dehydratase